MTKRMKAHFLSELDAKMFDEKANNGRGKWRLDNPLVYYSKILSDVVTVPEGFITDYASVPTLPFVYWLTGGTATTASVVHDYLYSTGICDRATADKVFLEAMEVTGVPAWRRYAMFAAVRSFGGSHYAKKKKAR